MIKSVPNHVENLWILTNAYNYINIFCVVPVAISIDSILSMLLAISFDT